MQMTDIFQLSSEELQALLHGEAAVIPELAGKTPQQLRALPAASMILDHCGTLMDGIEHIPQTGYSAYRLFKRYGERKTFERPYLLKRANLAAAVTRLLLGETETPAGTSLKDLIQDYLWNICEESNWILPAHEEFNIIDLFVAETGYQLALTLHLLGETLDGEVRSRVRAEIERRVFDPYLRFYSLHRWYKGPNNWTGVCNGAVAATFLLLEPEQQRTAQALKLALAGLETYLDRAFEKDGTSTEGVEYWQYGLTYFIILAEMLYSRSQGVLNLLGSPLMQKIAVYPAALQLTGSNCASFADCDEEVFLSHGLLSRLALRTGQRAQLQLMPRQLQPLNRTSLASLLCDLLWWDGRWLETSAP
ncbi:MAG: hypothetical protein J2P37_31685, partial [Ktedonobacteraceae bacterium]|nr:hypothetical protein [Ktedonobacteraceae bacterium]